jgi:hypothetical protein
MIQRSEDPSLFPFSTKKGIINPTSTHKIENTLLILSKIFIAKIELKILKY